MMGDLYSKKAQEIFLRTLSRYSINKYSEFPRRNIHRCEDHCTHKFAVLDDGTAAHGGLP